MPTSSDLGKQCIKEWFPFQKDIRTIVDVGAGMGTYRKLLGDSYKWRAIEVWRPYIKKYNLVELYDDIIIQDIKDIKEEELPEGDCIIFGDILEHLPKDTALEVLEKANRKYKHIVLSIPLGVYEQGEIEGNPYESHQSTWTYEEVEKLVDWSATQTFPVNPNLPEVLKIGVFVK